MHKTILIRTDTHNGKTELLFAAYDGERWEDAYRKDGSQVMRCDQSVIIDDDESIESIITKCNAAKFMIDHSYPKYRAQLDAGLPFTDIEMDI